MRRREREEIMRRGRGEEYMMKGEIEERRERRENIIVQRRVEKKGGQTDEELIADRKAQNVLFSFSFIVQTNKNINSFERK